MGIIAVVIAITQNNASANTTSANPCATYKADDLASGITLTCFRYMWANAGCKTSVPDEYAGWYLRSPDGGKTVLCIPPQINERCGAGSFGAVQNRIWRCDLDDHGF